MPFSCWSVSCTGRSFRVRAAARPKVSVLGAPFLPDVCVSVFTFGACLKRFLTCCEAGLYFQTLQIVPDYLEKRVCQVFVDTL